MSSDKYILQEVVDARTEREFLDLPRKIYKGNRNWVCPLDPSIRAIFDPKKNELLSDGEAIRWIARDKKGEVVGRIAAFYDREHAFLEEQPTGGCGFFEAINDQELADQLFDAARNIALLLIEIFRFQVGLGIRLCRCGQQAFIGQIFTDIRSLRHTLSKGQ